MKRYSITEILFKTMKLARNSDRYTTYKDGDSCSILAGRFVRNNGRILTAAVNEIIRLQVEDDFCKAVKSKIDMQEEADKLFDAVGIICKDYNDKILKP